MDDSSTFTQCIHLGVLTSYVYADRNIVKHTEYHVRMEHLNACWYTRYSKPKKYMIINSTSAMLEISPIS